MNILCDDPVTDLDTEEEPVQLGTMIDVVLKDNYDTSGEVSE